MPYLTLHLLASFKDISLTLKKVAIRAPFRHVNVNVKNYRLSTSIGKTQTIPATPKFVGD